MDIFKTFQLRFVLGAITEMQFVVIVWKLWHILAPMDGYIY